MLYSPGISSLSPLPMLSIAQKKKKKITRFDNDVSQTPPDNFGYTSYPTYPTPAAAARSHQTTAGISPSQEIDQQLELALAGTTSLGGTLYPQTEQQHEVASTPTASNKNVHIGEDEGAGHLNRLYGMLRDASSKVSGAGSAALAFSITGPGEHTTSLQKRIANHYQQPSAGQVGAPVYASLTSSNYREVRVASDDVHMDDEGGHLKRLHSSLSDHDVDGSSSGSSGGLSANDDATI